jgi:hypothetical protein
MITTSFGTFCFALLCVLARSSLNVLDRKIFSHRKSCLIQTHFLNTLLTAAIALPLTLALFGTQLLTPQLLSVATVSAAFTMHVVSFVFSGTFKVSNVRTVALFTKLADLFIPLSLFMASRFTHTSTLFMQFLTGVLVIPLLLKNRNQGHLNGWLVTLIVALTVQALVMATIGAGNSGESISHFCNYLTAIFLWRTVFALVPMIAVLRRSKINFVDGFAFDLAARALLMIVNYACFFLAVHSPDASLAWALFNSTGLFSLVFAKIAICEAPDRFELTTFIAIASASLIAFLI